MPSVLLAISEPAPFSTATPPKRSAKSSTAKAVCFDLTGRHLEQAGGFAGMRGQYPVIAITGPTASRFSASASTTSGLSLASDGVEHGPAPVVAAQTRPNRDHRRPIQQRFQFIRVSTPWNISSGRTAACNPAWALRVAMLTSPRRSGRRLRRSSAPRQPCPKSPPTTSTWPKWPLWALRATARQQCRQVFAAITPAGRDAAPDKCPAGRQDG
jgi:hypothetical protein